MSIQGCVVALFGALSDADEAVASLDAAGVPCRQVSMIARDGDELAERPVGELDLARVRERFARLQRFVAVWSQDRGGFVVLGPLAEVVAARTARHGAEPHGSMVDPELVGGLRERPIPSERVAAYEVLVGVGDVLLVVDGSDQTVRRAAWVLAHSSALAVDAFGRGSGRPTA